jgi:hypothetical protein
MKLLLITPSEFSAFASVLLEMQTASNCPLLVYHTEVTAHSTLAKLYCSPMEFLIL